MIECLSLPASFAECFRIPRAFDRRNGQSGSMCDWRGLLLQRDMYNGYDMRVTLNSKDPMIPWNLHCTLKLKQLLTSNVHNPIAHFLLSRILGLLCLLPAFPNIPFSK